VQIGVGLLVNRIGGEPKYRLPLLPR
jgi:hypothetical protein